MPLYLFPSFPLFVLTKLLVGVVHQPALNRGLTRGGGKAGHDRGIHLHDGLRPATRLGLGHGHNRLDGDESQGRGDQGKEDSTLHDLFISLSVLFWDGREGGEGGLMFGWSQVGGGPCGQRAEHKLGRIGRRDGEISCCCP